MLSINSIMFTLGSGNNNRLALVQFRPNQQNQGVTSINVPIQNANPFTSLLNKIADEAGRFNTSNLLSNVLDRAFNMIPTTNNNDGENYGKLAIMVTNCALNLGTNFGRLVDEFRHRNIKLYVVGLMAPEYYFGCDYRTLARRTGGQYILLESAQVILQQIIRSAIYEGYTLRQASQHIGWANVVAVPGNPGETNEENQTTDGVGELTFDHGLSE